MMEGGTPRTLQILFDTPTFWKLRNENGLSLKYPWDRGAPSIILRMFLHYLSDRFAISFPGHGLQADLR